MRKTYVLPVLADPHFVSFFLAELVPYPSDMTLKFTQVLVQDSDPHVTMLFPRVDSGGRLLRYGTGMRLGWGEDRKPPDNSIKVLKRLHALKSGDSPLKRKYSKIEEKCTQVHDMNYKMGALVLIEVPGKTTWKFSRPSSPRATGAVQVTATTGSE